VVHDPQTVNAYYNPLMNEIVFPAAILQYPFFELDRDAAANYGGIGAVIGHEIGHGFDDQGSAFDGTGALATGGRMTTAPRSSSAPAPSSPSTTHSCRRASPPSTTSTALSRSARTSETSAGSASRSRPTASLGADTTDEDADGPVIDGYTGIQRLLLSWAQIWQQKGREAETIRLLTIDPHSPNEFRCNQIVRNVDEFYRAFDVTETDALWLDADQRVTIW
jgi:putative endopeptidase